MFRTNFAKFAFIISLMAPVAGLLAKQTVTPIASNSRKPATDFSLENEKGVPVRLSDYHGKVVVLDFWATWCHDCKTEIPWYMEFQKKYQSKGLSVIGVSMDDDGWKSVKPYLQKNPINYSVVIGTSELAKIYGVEAMPVTLLIDRNGNIAATHSGMVNKATFEAEIQSLLRDESQDTVK
jgi:thiol-disulfide isomerase/thioredoxin